jgi:hypothetical protein
MGEGYLDCTIFGNARMIDAVAGIDDPGLDQRTNWTRPGSSIPATADCRLLWRGGREATWRYS